MLLGGRIASSAVTYGPFDTVLVVQSWLVGVGVVVFGGALTGRLPLEELPRVAQASALQAHAGSDPAAGDVQDDGR